MAKKQVPYSQEAEEGVIGSCLLDVKAFNMASEILIPSMFYLKENQLIFEAMCFLKDEKKPIDILTVRCYLDDRSLLEQIGGQQTLIKLTEGVFTTQNVEQYARTVRSKFLRRQLIRTGTVISEMGTNEDENIENLFASAENENMKLLSLVPSSSSLSLAENIGTYIDVRNKNKGKKLFGWSWGSSLKFLDDYTKGIIRKKVYRIGAPSGMGKTQFGAYNLIPSLLEQGAKVVFFALENDIPTTMNNLLANMQKVNNDGLMEGEIEANIHLLEPYEHTLTIVDNVNDLQQIFKTIREIKPDVVILDYVGLVQIKGVAEDRKYAEYARLVQIFAKEQDISWIDLSNLKMGQEDEQWKLVNAGHYYGATELKSNLDVGIFIIRNEDFFKFKNVIIEMNGEEGSERIPYKAVDVWITKNRGGIEMVRRTMIYEWDKGGRMKEATKEQRENWKTGFAKLSSGSY